MSLDRTAEFLSAVAFAGGSVQHAGPRARAPASYFSRTARGLAQHLSDARGLAEDLLSGCAGEDADDTVWTLAPRVEEAELTLTALAQRFGAELAALDAYAEAFAGAPAGEERPYLAAHQRGAVAILCARVRELVELTGELRRWGAVARALQPEPPEAPLELEAFAGGGWEVAGEGEAAPSGGRESADEPAAGGKGLAGAGGLRWRGSKGGVGAGAFSRDAEGRGALSLGSGGGDGTKDSAPGSAAPQQLLQLASEQEAVDAQRVESAMGEVATMLSLIGERLAEQSEGVVSLLDDAVTARAHVASGNEQLQQVRERPSSLRDFVVTILVALMTLLLWLDWYAW